MRQAFRVYGIALALLVAAVGLRWLLDPVLGDALPLVTLFGAVAAAVWTGGRRPAVLVAVLGYVACYYLFIPPRGALNGWSAANIVGLVAYLLTSSIIIMIGGTMRRVQQHALRSSELVRVTLASIGDAVITTDTQGRVTYMNPVAESLTGWKDGEARGRSLEMVFRIIDEDTRQPVQSPAQRALQEGMVVGLANHSLLVGRDGVERAIDDSAAPIRDEERRVSGCILVFRDITARRQIERDEADRLLAARMLAAIVETSDDAIVSKSLEGIIQSWNGGAERMFGYTAEEAVGRHISLIIPPERLAEEDEIIASLKAGNRVDHIETERLRRDGQHLLVSLTISPLKDASGNVVGASKIARDVTRQRQAEADRQMFTILLENSADFVGICDLQGVPFYVNRAGLAMVGLESVEEARHKNLRDFFFPEDQAKVVEEFVPAVLERGHGEMEVRFRNFKTGQGRWMVYKVLKLSDAAGRTMAIGTVSHDVTGRKMLEDSLRKVAADLSEANRRKNEFLATLSHELRNPLAPLTHMLEVLKRGGEQPELRERAVETMKRQLGQLVRLVDDLLDLNRITHNRIELRKGPVDLSTVIRQAAEAWRPLAASAGQDLQVTLPEEPLLLKADPARLAQVFGNLMHNACKYTSPGGRIEVRAERRGEEAWVTVEDTGVGIEADQLGSIFDMFAQVGGAARRSQGGLGIGLTLVKRLVEMHGGTVEAQSEGAGQGSTFLVRLPLGSEVSPIPDAPLEARSVPATNRRVLVVDDNEDAAGVLTMLLKMSGNEVHTAYDGAVALEAVDRLHPDVVLLDIGLPSLNGYEVCRRIRQRPWGRNTVLIALTGWGQAEDRRLSQEAGFDGHLVKPVDFMALQVLMDSLAASKGS